MLYNNIISFHIVFCDTFMDVTGWMMTINTQPGENRLLTLKSSVRLGASKTYISINIEATFINERVKLKTQIQKERRDNQNNVVEVINFTNKVSWH